MPSPAFFGGFWSDDDYDPPPPSPPPPPPPCAPPPPPSPHFPPKEKEILYFPTSLPTKRLVKQQNRASSQARPRNMALKYQLLGRLNQIKT